jgi:2-polyprenyl-6-methoxyphenol hydroxylase-like FAD-dependent oxidoreductase
VLFFDRQWLLEVLYAKVQHKERILLSKRVAKIEHIQNSVRVDTTDGSSFTGTMVLGVDGIYSTVRQSMIELGNQIKPGYFPRDESDRVPCHIQCSFGMAQDVPNYPLGEMNTSRGKGCSQLIVPGANGKIYWFVFVRLPEVKYGKDIPRYTQEDEVAFAKKHADMPVTDKVRFGDVFSRRISSALTPIHEVVFQRWFFRRILIFGDAAHKVGWCREMENQQAG